MLIPVVALIAVIASSIPSNFAHAADGQITFNTQQPSATTPSQVKLASDIWHECTDPKPETYIMRPVSVIIEPETPTIGKDISVKITADSIQEITSGTVNVVLYVGLIKVPHKLDLCDVLSSSSDVTCPLKKGRNEITIKQYIPGDIPPMNLKGRVTITDEQKRTLTCFEVQFALQKS